MLERVAHALGGGEDEDDPAVAALKAKIGAIAEAAQATGALDEKALARLVGLKATDVRVALKRSPRRRKKRVAP